MAYLSFDEYDGAVSNGAEFKRLESQAETVINNVTRDFYRYHDLSADQNKFRVADFKQAVKEQIEYYAFAQASKSYEIQQGNYKAVSIGRLSLTPANASVGLMPNGLCKEAYELLAKHGLLFRGAW
ncbi:hypothetical protein [Limosilactobacillus mucosae]|uniref:hypothetical protein n=1 Tax=Limosilactobacillus mucosae TaxID=97478 RepID=UPI003B9CE1D6